MGDTITLGYTKDIAGNLYTKDDDNTVVISVASEVKIMDRLDGIIRTTHFPPIKNVTKSTK